MPTPRRYANPAQRQAAYRQRTATARRQEQEAKGLPPLPVVATLPGHPRWHALGRQALQLLETMLTEMQAYYEQRSEPWQDSERGEAFHERLQDLQEAYDVVADLLPPAELDSRGQKHPP